MVQAPEQNNVLHEAFVEPLTQATEQALRRLRLTANDFLLVDLDDEGSRFAVELLCLVAETSLDAADKPRIEVDGRRFVRHSWRQPSNEAHDFVHHRVPESQWLGSLPRAKRNPRMRNMWLLGGTDVTALMLHACWPPEQLIFKTEDARMMYEFLITRFFAQTRRAELMAKVKRAMLEGVKIYDKVKEDVGEADWEVLEEALNAAKPRVQALVEEALPPVPNGYTWIDHEDPEFRLEPYQKAAVLLGLGSSYALHMDPGTGKTPVSVQRVCLEAYKKHQAGEGLYRVLCIVPGQVRTNWQREFDKFAVVPGKTVILRGGLVERLRLCAQAMASEEGKLFSAAIASYDTLASSLDQGGAAILEMPWDLIVTDEAHYFKADYTKRWKEMVRPVTAKCDVFELTGSPIGNSVMDLWTQLEAFGEGQSGFTTFKNFRKFHGQWEAVDDSAHGVERLVGVQNIPLLQERLARMTFTVTEDEAGLNLPPKVFDVHEIEMTKRQAEAYQALEEQLAHEIIDEMSGKVVDAMTAENILTKLLRLAQITTGYVTWDEVRDPTTAEVVRAKRIEWIDPIEKNPKISAVCDMLLDPDRDPRGKTVVWGVQVPFIEEMHGELQRRGVKGGHYYGATNDDFREAWGGPKGLFNRDRDFKYLVCSPLCAAEGLNLHGYDAKDPSHVDTYCDHVIVANQNWSSILRRQLIKRAHRRGTRKPVRITDLVVPGTIDVEILDRVESKIDMAGLVADLRNVLQSVLGISV